MAKGTGVKKHLVVVAGQTPPPVGGQNVMIGRLLDELSGDGRWIVEHLAFNFTPSFNVVRRAKFSKIWELLKVYRRALALILRHGRADLLVYPSGGAETVPVIRDVLLLPIMRVITKRLWVQFHAAGVAERLGARGGILEHALLRSYRGVDGAIVMTEFNQRDPAALGIRSVEVIPHRLPDENTSGLLPDFSARPLRILYAGHLYDQKGTPDLIEAFADIACIHAESRLVLMGEFLPPYSEEVCRARCSELGVADRVEITGILRGSAKAEQFRKAHFFVFPSVAPYESFGLVMAEAMMWGLPLLVSDWRGNRDVAGAGAEYFEVGPSAARNLSRSLCGILGRPDLWLARATYSRNRFVSLFSQERTVYSDFVARLLAKEAAR